MAVKILWKAQIKKHKGTCIGIFVLIVAICVALCSVITLSVNGDSYIAKETDRLGFGKLTVWVSDVDDIDKLSLDISAVDGIRGIKNQQIIYSEYETAAG